MTEHIVNVADIREANGKTVRENNLAMEHEIPIDTLVELKGSDWKGNGAVTKFHARLFVVAHTRDCDGTPLYCLADGKRSSMIGLLEEVYNYEEADKMRKDDKYVFRNLSYFYKFFNNYSKESLTPIEITPEILSGEDTLSWEEETVEGPEHLYIHRLGDNSLIGSIAMVNRAGQGTCSHFRVRVGTYLASREDEAQRLATVFPNVVVEWVD